MVESISNTTPASANDEDSLQTFLFESCNVRGEIVRLGSSWRTIQERRSYPPAIQRHLGEMVAAGALLCATLKFDGTLILQAQGTGPVQLLVVECTADLTIRATVKMHPDLEAGSDLPKNLSLSELINPDGNGKLAITLAPKKRQEGQQAYQGIVPLMNEKNQAIESIAEAVTIYMRNSEQLETRIWLASDDQFSAGMLLQRLPQMGGKQLINPKSDEELEDTWNRLQLLAGTCSDEELLNTPPEKMMRRLFQEESEWQEVRCFPMRAIQFQCTCSRERVGNMLLLLGHDEVEDILSEQGKIETSCDFCGASYQFDAVDCKQLFSSDNLVDGIRPPLGNH